jgi:alkylation response protein AidB-like acyl-CoA dehydrogenase
MDFKPSDEQWLLERFIRENYDQMARRKLMESPAGFSREHWSFFADMGLPALPFLEANGGLGGGPDEHIDGFIESSPDYRIQ